MHLDIHDHLVDHVRNKALVKDNLLYVIGVVSNPERYHSRYRLFRKWMGAMENTPNVKLVILECAYGDRHHEVTDPMNPFHLRLRSHQHLWLKENLINLAVRALPQDWKYVAWVDTDVFWEDPNWAQEALHQLQTYDLIQPWRDCLDLGPHGEVMQHFQSFSFLHQRGVRMQTSPTQPYKYGHSGYAWACTRTFWENVKGLMEFNVVGSGDHHQAWASIGKVDHSVHGKMSDGFKKLAREWQRDAFRVTHGHLGFVNTTISHAFHGSKQARGYRSRWQIFIDHKFDPEKDLRKDSQGVVQLVGKPQLEEDIRSYFRSRNEDSIDME